MSMFEQIALPLFEAHRRPWLDVAREKARQLGANGDQVTIDMVRAECPPPADVDPRVNGAVFLKSEWKKVGYVNSHRMKCHGRPVAVFMLKSARTDWGRNGHVLKAVG